MKINLSNKLALLLVGFMMLAGGCDFGNEESLHDPDAPDNPAPTITSIEPAVSGLAGVGTIVLNGTGFSDSLSQNLVFFDQTSVEVVSATATRLEVTSPDLPGDIDITVSSAGATEFSSAAAYTLETAVSNDVGGITDLEQPFGLATDVTGNIYVSMNASNVSAGIQRILVDGTRENYISSTFKWDGMTIDDAGDLFAVRGIRAVFKFAAGGGAQQTWAAFGASVKLRAIDIDANNNLWAGGNNTALYKIAADQSKSEYSFTGDVKGLTVHDNALYVAATVNDNSEIWKFNINGNGDLDAGTKILDIGTNYDGAEAWSIAVAQNGDAFIGTDGADALIELLADGTHNLLYPGLVAPTGVSMAWGTGNVLYMTRNSPDTAVKHTIAHINTLRQGDR